MASFKCAFPVTAYWFGELNKETGGKVLKFGMSYSSMNYKEVYELPCNTCYPCQARRKAVIGLRAMHEATEHLHNCFITLTVNDCYMNEVFPDNSLNHRPFQLFAKRLRKFISCKYPELPPIKILMCGEYGEEKNRPHFHAIIFGFDFEDKIKFGKYYISNTLAKLWQYGFHSIGEVNFDSCAYIAKYVVKKKDDKDYINEDTGVFRKKEYIVYPKGLGLKKFEKYYKDWYNLGYIYSQKGFKMSLPSYYDRKYAELEPEKMELIKEERKLKLLQARIETLTEARNRNKVLELKEQLYSKRR